MSAPMSTVAAGAPRLRQCPIPEGKRNQQRPSFLHHCHVVHHFVQLPGTPGLAPSRIQEQKRQRKRQRHPSPPWQLVANPRAHLKHP
eukprot:11396944-Prorocentrum_lima.AAC.1